jgi:hypothetical protein
LLLFLEIQAVFANSFYHFILLEEIIWTLTVTVTLTVTITLTLTLTSTPTSTPTPTSTYQSRFS